MIGQMVIVIPKQKQDDYDKIKADTSYGSFLYL